MRLRPLKNRIKIPTHMIRAKPICSRLVDIALLPLQRRVRAARQRGLDIFKAVPDVVHGQAAIRLLSLSATVAVMCDWLGSRGAKVPASEEIVKFLG